MKLEPGFIGIAIAMAIFYLRLAQLRGRKRRIALRTAPAKSKGARRKNGQPQSGAESSPTAYEVTSWWLVGLGILFMLGGLALRTYGWLPAPYAAYWWVLVTAGVAVFIFCFR